MDWMNSYAFPSKQMELDKLSFGISLRLIRQVWSHQNFLVVQIKCIVSCLNFINSNLRSEQSSIMMKTLGWSVETLKKTLFSQPTVAGLTHRKMAVC